MGRGGLTVNHADVRAPVTGYRTGLVRITLGNERLVEWIGSFHEASSNFVSIGRARSTASIRRLFFYKAFTISPNGARYAFTATRITGSHIVRVPQRGDQKGPVIPFHIIPFFVPFQPLPHIPPVFERSRKIRSSLPLDHGIDGWMDGWMDYRANLNKPELRENMWKIRSSDFRNSRGYTVLEK